jgi:hypothetical protein
MRKIVKNVFLLFFLQEFLANSLPGKVQPGTVDEISERKVDLRKEEEPFSRMRMFCCGGVLCGFMCGAALDYYLNLPGSFCIDRFHCFGHFKTELNLPKHTFKFVLANIGLLGGFCCGIKNKRSSLQQ